MPAKRDESKIPKEIPMEPFYYQFLLDSISEKQKRSCVKAALDKYNKACMKAFKDLQNDLKHCQKAAAKE